MTEGIQLGVDERSLFSYRAFSMLIIGVGILAAVMGCASTPDRERRALSAEFDKWLGQYKDHRIIERGQPDRCIAQGGGSEICEWRIDGGTVRYLYDANGIARRWKYADPQLGEMKGAQEPPSAADQIHESEAAVWKTIKETFDDMKFTPIGVQ
jgi:hypothetical protein